MESIVGSWKSEVRSLKYGNQVLLLLVLVVLILSGYKKDDDIPDYVYNTPQSYDDGIETASLNSIGLLHMRFSRILHMVISGGSTIIL